MTFMENKGNFYFLKEDLCPFYIFLKNKPLIQEIIKKTENQILVASREMEMLCMIKKEPGGNILFVVDFSE
jgi:hypothetical protein